MEQYQLTQTISAPTRMTLTSSSFLDVCLAPEKLITSKVVSTTISDHYMIVIVCKINVFGLTKANFEIVNKILYRKQKCSEINPIKTQNGKISDPAKLTECFNDYFTNVGPNIAKTIDNCVVIIVYWLYNS